MSLDTIKERIPGYAKDLRLNLSSVLTEEGAPGLSQKQIFGIAYASALGSRDKLLANDLLKHAGDALAEQDMEAAKSAAAIMGMNNIYYRFLHLSSNDKYKTMPAQLRMTAIGSHGVDKVDFELYSLAVSAINGCGMCVDSHEKQLQKAGVNETAIQSAIRIASVVHAIAALDTPIAA